MVHGFKLVGCIIILWLFAFSKFSKDFETATNIMSYNKYNGRYSTRYNTPGKFVPASESQPRWILGNSGHVPPMPQMDNVQFNNPVSKGQLKLEQQQSQQQPPMQPQQSLHPGPQQQQQQPDEDPQKNSQQIQPPQSELDTKQEVTDTDAPARPFWMKSKLQGVKKINNRERRRRQNETLRRLLAPKNALMVLNEMLPGDTLTSQFKVEALAAGSPVRAPHAYCAQLALDTQTYTGYGETKIVARNAAAEQAIRDLMIQRMERVLQDRGGQEVSMDTELLKKPGSGEAEGEAAGEGESAGEVESAAEALPMIQLASFALHKLFAEWECGGHRVPQLKSNTAAAAEGTPAGASARPKVRALPPHAGSMHPCSLLTHMRPQQAYYELPAAGAPHGTVFSVALDIDGQTYVGKATSKKEARRVAARAACEALYDVHFELP